MIILLKMIYIINLLAKPSVICHNSNMKINLINNNVCPHYAKCGACQLQHMSYRRQLAFKAKKVSSFLGSYGVINSIIGMRNPLNYRNKVQAAFAPIGKNGIVSGQYEASTHKIVPIDSCMIEDKTADEIIVYIRQMLTRFHIKPYNEITKQGTLRHVLVRRGFSTNQIMVVLVTAVPALSDRNNFLRDLLSAFPDITTVIQNINGDFTSMVLGEHSTVLYGKGYIEDVLCGYVFRISPKSFYQVNPLQTEKLYRKAIEYAQLSMDDVVLDAYCGIGTIGISASGQCKSVIGVEINKDAVRDAISNARRNNVNNAYFVCADAGEYIRESIDEGEYFNVVFMDPPRSGSDKKFLSSLISLKPQRIVYISCNPATLARDVEYLVRNKYSVSRIQPVDMFPYTEHVETIVLLTASC